ncbi:MAG TPA: CPBP family intramembrane glutamic endopeptidase [Xanthobacteraceae bacterium]|nr:CPBP family intramembrane glutamic endopeptidase [Xanthobacteraceae bacterium]
MTIRGSLAKILPYLATMAWAVVAFLAGQAAALAVLLRWYHGDVEALYAAQYDGAVVTLSVLVLNPVIVGVLMFAVRLSGAKPAEYLALVWPPMRTVMAGIIGIVVIIALTDALLFVSGRAIVSDFQTVSYTTAAAEGWLPLMWIATVLVAPAGEEILFRGYLFRGFVRSERSAWPAIIVISLLWASLHLQYDWTGMTEIGVAGLFLGWVRWRSGSTLLTFLLHALFNLEGMLETVAQVKHLF